MIKTLKQIINMKGSLWANAFFYYFNRLWLIGKLMPENIYSSYTIKKVVSVFTVIFRQLIECFGKPIYILFFVAFPIMSAGSIYKVSSGLAVPLMMQLLFFLSGIIGAFSDSQIFTVTRDKITCIKYLHMNSRTYIHGFLAFKYVPFFTYYLIWIITASCLLGGTVLQGIFIWIMLFSLRMLSEAIQLKIFDRTGKVLSRNMAFAWGAILLGMAGAYVPFIMKAEPVLGKLLLNPLCAAVFAAVGGFCLWYITLGYKSYEEKFHRSIDLNYLLSTALKSNSSGEAIFKDVAIKEKDITVGNKAGEKIKHLKGYAYINALFFARHRRQLVKPVIYRLIAAACLLVGGVVFWRINSAEAVKLGINLTSILPLCVYFMYFMTVADKAARAMFYNCDKDMLRYSYYREPQSIIKNFQIRLFRVSLYNIAIALAVCFAGLVFSVLCNAGITADFLLFSASIILLSILFTAHHLCLYYVFQPYSESLQMKNPFFSAINGIMYMLCFICLQINVGGLVFTISLLAFTVFYITAALFLVYFRAPKSFRVK